MSVLSVASRVAAVSALVVVLMAAGAAQAQLQTCTASTLNPLASLDYTVPSVELCVRDRCVATLGTVPTIRTGGYCDGVATSESAVPCETLTAAYNAYYACVMRALESTTVVALADVSSAVQVLMNTPGYPYHLSPLGCYACNHFRDTVFPALGSTCAAWTCDLVASQNPATVIVGDPGKGYNQQLCGTGCIAAMLLTIPFALVSASMFVVCGCCWPSPSLKTTYLEVQKEEEAERQRARSDDDDDDDEDLYPPGGRRHSNVAHEPAGGVEQVNHPEDASDPEEYVDLR